MKDWNERELEDYLAEHCESILSEGAVLYGRQVRCVAGIIDLIVGMHNKLCVVELKARKADSRDVGQVCRYAETVSQHIYAGNMNVMTAVDDPYGHHAMGDMGNLMEITPILVAPDYEQHVPHMCTFYQASQTEDGFDLQYVSPRRLPKPTLDDTELIDIMDRFARTLLWSHSLCEASRQARTPLRYDLRWPETS